jgi:thiamine-monophosphate kinase
VSNPETVADRGEFGLIEAIAKRLPQGKNVLVPPGDDAAVIEVDGVRTAVTTDVLVSGVHVRVDWADAHDIGRRAAAASLADVVAMGAQPVALVVALVMPPDTEAAWALRLADGLRDEAELVSASVVGGDISTGPILAITVSAVGAFGKHAAVVRSGAQPGDQVAVAGRLGWAAAGLAVLSRGFGTPRALVDAYRRPDVQYDVALKARNAGAHAMCDVSDGLLADLGHIAVASGVVIDVERDRLEVGEPVASVAAAYGTDPLGWVLGGGDDHAFVATFAAKKRLPQGWTRIGVVRGVEDEDTGPTVTVDGELWPGSAGHAHFGQR